jgi:hypothetical protein
MRWSFLLVSTVLFTLSSGAGAGEKPRTAEELYQALGGLWRPVDEKKPLEVFWLHRNEKGVPEGPNDGPWRVRLAFTPRGPDDFSGQPAQVEADGNGLKVTLPDSAKARTLRIDKRGDRFVVEVAGGQFAGVYQVQRRPSKQ